ncbi:hypothetical protein [Actinomadura madurae]|uniref:hypothetical protein n=1 Tax=Actinomadura madurae TaxID=1993 RepID=UPI0020D24D66|nr:hypothetical protein [Actinomadura madurae]MCP9947189.1 hypothetical protein [Actinomadura madurae]MCP9963954.1 hypothetical protein [Actinomadura madurae]MCP9976428.1 hypothetical protein [Actinomadura madurae]MCQ0012079.1 hypothetical protein [Actinomadura madurae]MCQ0012621.1 hypothetical protein [Actinomadura madurae]
MTSTQDKTRERLAKHLAWHPNSGDCLQCAAARLAETFPGTVPTHAERPVLEDMLDVAERAAKELDAVIDHLDGEHGATLRDALNSVAVSTSSGALTAILARAACGPDQAEAALGKARKRLDRIRILHLQLVDEHRTNPSVLERLGVSNLRADIIRRLAQAWRGHLPADPYAPLTHDK